MDSITTDGYYEVKQILEWFASEISYPDPLHRPKWLNPRYISNILKTLGFRDKRRVAVGVEVNIRKDFLNDQAKRMGMQVKDADKVTWIKSHIPKIVPSSVISLEMTYRNEFGDTEQNLDLFWLTIKQLREDNEVTINSDDMINWIAHEDIIK